MLNISSGVREMLWVNYDVIEKDDFTFIEGMINRLAKLVASYPVAICDDGPRGMGLIYHDGWDIDISLNRSNQCDNTSNSNSLSVAIETCPDNEIDSVFQTNTCLIVQTISTTLCETDDIRNDISTHLNNPRIIRVQQGTQLNVMSQYEESTTTTAEQIHVETQ